MHHPSAGDHQVAQAGFLESQLNVLIELEGAIGERCVEDVARFAEVVVAVGPILVFEREVAADLQAIDQLQFFDATREFKPVQAAACHTA